VRREGRKGKGTGDRESGNKKAGNARQEELAGKGDWKSSNNTFSIRNINI
jgi:hypothetical protein